MLRMVAVPVTASCDVVVPVRAVVVAVGDVVDAVLQVHHRATGFPRAHAGDHRRLGREQLRAEAAARRKRPSVEPFAGIFSEPATMNR